MKHQSKNTLIFTKKKIEQKYLMFPQKKYNFFSKTHFFSQKNIILF